MNANSLAKLLAAGPSGVYRLSGSIAPARLASHARHQGLKAFRVDCSRARSKQTFLFALARALAFPDYFGANWDALADCLTDLEWIQADGYVILLAGLQGFARQAPRDYLTALDVLEDTAQYWAEEGVPFYVLVEALPDAALPEITAR